MEEYNPEWPARFEEIKAILFPLVHDLISTIEHVGSTSVPLLAAKPVIDIDMVLPEKRFPEDLPILIKRLNGIGYTHRGNLGVEGREAFLAPPGGSIAHHLYACREGCLALKNHLSLRDHLRQNPLARKEYGRLKKKLALQFPTSIDDYVGGKTDFILQILEGCGFDEGQRSAIHSINNKNSKDIF